MIARSAVGLPLGAESSAGKRRQMLTSLSKPFRSGWLILFLIIAALPLGAAVQEGEDVGQTLIHHVVDSRSWRPLPFLPQLALSDITIGAIQVPITKHVVMMLLTSMILIAVFVGAFGRVRLVPSLVGNALEPLVFFVRDSIVIPAMGEKLGTRWLPFFLTLFFFLLALNLLGLIPMFPTVTANVSITAGLAAMILCAIIAQGMAANGVIGFFRNMVPDGIPAPIGVFLLLIESLSLVIRSAVLAIRLFANMLAGHFVIISLLMLMMIVHPAAGVVSIPLALFIDLLEVLVAIIQAMVFTMLSAIFIGMASTHH